MPSKGIFKNRSEFLEILSRMKEGNLSLKIVYENSLRMEAVLYIGSEEDISRNNIGEDWIEHNSHQILYVSEPKYELYPRRENGPICFVGRAGGRNGLKS